MCKDVWRCLPEKTLTAHRACISTKGIAGPFAYTLPIIANVWNWREEGNSPLKKIKSNLWGKTLKLYFNIGV